MPSTRRLTTTTASSTARPRLLRSTVPSSSSSSWRRRSKTVPSSKPRSLGVEKRGQRRREGGHGLPQQQLTLTTTATTASAFFRCREACSRLLGASELAWVQEGMIWSSLLPSSVRWRNRNQKRDTKGKAKEEWLGSRQRRRKKITCLFFSLFSLHSQPKKKKLSTPLRLRSPPCSPTPRHLSLPSPHPGTRAC